MDLDKFYNEKYITHWAQELQTGDRCLATIRHKTDGSKNKHNVEVIVIENNIRDSKIMALFLGEQEFIRYNELSEVTQAE
jgi:hypothetical protein